MAFSQEVFDTRNNAFEASPFTPVNARLSKHDISMITPISAAVHVKPPLPHCAIDVGDVLHSIIEYIINNVGESEFLTPPQKLLKSIDTVEKAVMEQLQIIKETPVAKKEKREKILEFDVDEMIAVATETERTESLQF